MLKVLDRQGKALGRVLECLDAEQSALLSRDLDALTRCTEQKGEALAASDALEKERRALAPSLEAMESLAQDARVKRSWEQLLELTRHCRERNESNGRLIRRQQRRVNSTLDLLRGNEPSRSGGSLYGPDGEQRRGKGRAPIASV